MATFDLSKKVKNGNGSIWTQLPPVLLVEESYSAETDPLLPGARGNDAAVERCLHGQVKEASKISVPDFIFYDKNGNSM